MELIPVDPSLTRSAKRRQPSWVSRWVPAILYVLLIGVVFSVWYFTRDRGGIDRLVESKRSADPTRPFLDGLELSSRPIAIPKDARKIEHARSVCPPLRTMARTCAPRALEAWEECLSVVPGGIGSIIVRSVENGTPTIRQILEHGRPVECVSDHRLY